MNAAARLATYGMVLVAMTGAGAAIGAAAGPIDVAEETHGGHEPASQAADIPAGGLLVAQDGYELRVPRRSLPAHASQRFSFTVVGPDGSPVRTYRRLHDRELHLVIVSNDLATYSHLHPERATDGTWTADLPPLDPGVYRAYADFSPAGGGPLTLGVDLTVPGALRAPVPLTDRRSTRVEGFDVDLEGSAHGADTSTLSVTVRKDGSVVTTDPYLGAAGHLVAIRDGDLAYLHVHPMDDEPAGPVAFGVEFPSPGTYALFFDFSVDGQVHTASFVVVSGSTPTEHR